MQRRTFLKLAVGGGAAAVFPPPWLGSGWATEVATDSSPIVFNQLGYLPNATLRAPGKTFSVCSQQRRSSFAGKACRGGDDPASGERIQISDFSAVRQPGTYVLETDAGKSAPFEIGNNVYRQALWLTMRSYYGQRCGCNVDLGNGYSHPVCPLAAEFHPTSGKSGSYKNHGGRHDAGDYGRYIVNSGISTATLLRTIESQN